MRRLVIGLIILLIVLIGGLVWQKNKASAPAAHTSSKQTTKPSSTDPPPATFDRQQYSTTDPASIWVVVNKQHPLDPKNYAPSDLVGVGHGQYLRAAAAGALQSMLSDAQTAGFVVTPASGYRSYETQVSVYNNEVKTNGQAVADSESARPGYSEHQTGLAMDLASGGCSITDCFGNTPGGQWVTANAYKYGFILRYPADKTDITGYRTETWHFRYVGIPLATQLHTQNIQTLEEFFTITGGPTYN